MAQILHRCGEAHDDDRVATLFAHVDLLEQLCASTPGKKRSACGKRCESENASDAHCRTRLAK
jgi:hypothetical protein